jgi:hypothetical protein
MFKLLPSALVTYMWTSVFFHLEAPYCLIGFVILLVHGHVVMFTLECAAAR